MTYALQRDSILRTRQDLVVVGVRECQNFYAQLVQQLLTRTEEMDHADWVKTSSTVTADNATAPDGTATADSVLFNAANDAINQTVVGTAVTSKSFTGSVWLRVTTGTNLVSIRVRNAAATEIGVKQVTVTTTWTRFWVHKLFSAVPVDDVVFAVVRLAGDDIGSFQMWGANLAQNQGAKNFEVKFPYRKRVAEVVSTLSVNVSRCNIADNTNGSRCYYSRPTCQDPDNFNAGNTYELEPRLIGIREYRFCRQNAALPLPSEDVWPMLTGFPMAAQEIDPERAVTVNERVTFEFEDDAAPGLWNPRQQAEGALVNTATGVGTFWRRWVAIYRNYSNPECYVQRKAGYVEAGMTEADFQTRGKYLMLNFEMNDRKARLVCGDRLKLTRKDIPAKISDDNLITENMTQGQATMKVTNAEEVPAPGTGYTVTIEIDPDGTPEKVNVTARDLTTNTLTILRGRWGTNAAAHNIVPGVGLPFRVIYEFGTERLITAGVPLGKNPVDIVIELAKYAGLTASEIDSTTLEADRDVWLFTSVDTSTGAQYGPLMRRTLTEVTDIETLWTEIRDLTLMMLWVNAGQMLTGRLFAPLRPDQSYTEVTDDANIIAGTFAIDDNTEARLSRVLVAYDLTVDGGEKAEDYDKVRVELDVDSEERELYGDQRLKVVLSKWLQDSEAGFDSSITAEYFTSHIIARFRHGPRIVTTQLEVKDDEIEIGSRIRVNSDLIQDAHGNALPSFMDVIKKRQIADNRFSIEALDHTSAFGRPFFYAPNGTADYTAATEAEKRYGFLSDPQGFVGSPLEIGYVAT